MNRALRLLAVAAVTQGCGSSSAGGAGQDGGTPDHAVAHADAGGARDAGGSGDAAHDASLADHTAPSPDSGSAGDAARPADSSPARESGSASSDAAQDALDAGRADAATDASAGDAAVPPGGPLDLGSGFALLGVTDDGFAIYQTASSIKAVAITGGAPIVVLSSAALSGSTTAVLHDLVLIVTVGTGGAPLHLWSHSLGQTVTLATATTVPYVNYNLAVSADSSAVMYMDAVPAGGATGTLFGVSLSNLAAPVALATGVALTNNNCPPTLGFSGSGASTRGVASFCTSVTATTSTAAPVVSYHPAAGWAATILESNASDQTDFALDATGHSVAITKTGGSAGSLEIVPISGGSPVSIASGIAATGADSSTVYLGKTDAFVLAVDSIGLQYATTSGGSRTTLANNVAGIFSVSPDETLVMGSIDNNVISLSSTSHAGTVHTLPSAPGTAGYVEPVGDAFTADSSHAVYLSNGAFDANSDTLGTLTAVAAGSPTTPIVLTGRAFLPSSPVPGTTRFATADTALVGSKLAFSAQHVTDAGATRRVDVLAADLTAPTLVTTVVSDVDPYYAVSFDRRYVVYTVTLGTAEDGIHSVVIP